MFYCYYYYQSYYDNDNNKSVCSIVIVVELKTFFSKMFKKWDNEVKLGRPSDQLFVK